MTYLSNVNIFSRTRFLFAISSILLFLNTSNTFANESDSTIRNIFTHIYNQEFESAHDLLKENNNKLDPFYLHILSLDLLWWKFNIHRTDESAKELLYAVKRKNSNNEDRIILLIEKSYLMRYYKKKYKFYQVLRVRSEIRSLLAEIKEEQISLPKNSLKLFELYVAMFTYFDHTNLFFPGKASEERDRSLETMKAYSNEEDQILSTMAHYFTGRIYQKVEQIPEKGMYHFEVLTKRFPGNELFQEYFNDCAKKN